MDVILKLSKLFGDFEKRRFILLFFLMLFGAILETIGISSIVPFIGMVMNPNIVLNNEILSFIYNFFSFENTGTFLVLTAAVLLLMIISKNLYMFIYYAVQYRFIFNQQIKLSSRLFESYLKKDYTFHLQRNSSELLRNVDIEVDRLFNFIIIPGLLFFSEIMVVTCVALLLIFLSPIATFASSVFFIGSFYLFFKLFRKKINVLAIDQQKSRGEMIKWVNQGLGANKEVKVLGIEDFFVKTFIKQGLTYAKTMKFYKHMSEVPRLYIETIIVSVVLITVMIVTIQGEDLSTLISTLALFVMASFRLMPSINRLTNSLTHIRYNKPALDIIFEDLTINQENENEKQQKLEEIMELEYKEFIELKNVSFKYPQSSTYSVKDVSLKIPVGNSIAFVGQSGAGKTTIMDIILGILKPTEGKVLVDNVDINKNIKLWREKVGYIPQTIYLSDDTLRRNVAFGIQDENIDDEAILKALEAANLTEFVLNSENKLDTFVGERGVKLSGGQRQRIGIARALYHNPDILFLDEATSALDNETEKEVMHAIDRLKGKKTLIIIAHRLSTIENCDYIFEFKDGKLIDEKRKSVYAQKSSSN